MELSHFIAVIWMSDVPHTLKILINFQKRQHILTTPLGRHIHRSSHAKQARDIIEH
jgi:hypothetical protein